MCTINSGLTYSCSEATTSYRVTLECWKISSNRKNTYSTNNINNGNFLLRMVLVLLSGLFRDQSPQLVKVDSRHVVLILAEMEVSHTKLIYN